MESQMNDNGEWVDRRMALLEPGADLTPNAARALGRLHTRDRRSRVARRNLTWGVALASVVCIVALALPPRALCCTKPADEIPASNYRQSGSPVAPITIEIYSDFECPACAVFYRDTYPRLVTEYVKTGRVRIVHRDFPLPMHPYAKLAARYANAAGELGQYEAVFNRLFETQAEWGANGKIEAAIAPVLTPGALSKIRELVVNDPRLDDSVDEPINQTPTLIVVVNGQRHKLAGAPTFGVLSAYLEELLKSR
jgi:protein-disulfide isomerase